MFVYISTASVCVWVMDMVALSLKTNIISVAISRIKLATEGFTPALGRLQMLETLSRYV